MAQGKPGQRDPHPSELMGLPTEQTSLFKSCQVIIRWPENSSQTSPIWLELVVRRTTFSGVESDEGNAALHLTYFYRGGSQPSPFELDHIQHRVLQVPDPAAFPSVLSIG